MIRIAAAVSLALAVTLSPAGAQTPAAAASPALSQRAADAVAVLRAEKPAADVFAPSFLAAVSAEQLEAMTAQMASAYGAPVAIESVTPANATSAAIVIRFERALGRGDMVIAPEAPHLITGLRLTGFEPIGDSVEKIAADVAALPGKASAWFGPLEGRTPVIAHGADQPLALGSAFKLYVLAALDRAVREGHHSWDEVVPLEARSYPSGLTQEWPQGAPATLATLATLMIQISDNTATDQLISLLGRERVEAEFARTNRDAAPTLPFLTTREIFVIKSDPALRDRYAAADTAGRRALLAEVAEKNTPTAEVGAAFSGAPLAIDRIEWFASAGSLARLLEDFTVPEADMARAILTANKALDPATTAKWDYVGYKGGSEPGVLNLTWLLRDKAGRWHMLALGWNNPAAPVDTARLMAIAQRILALGG